MSDTEPTGANSRHAAMVKQIMDDPFTRAASVMRLERAAADCSDPDAAYVLRMLSIGLTIPTNDTPDVLVAMVASLRLRWDDGGLR